MIYKQHKLIVGALLAIFGLLLPGSGQALAAPVAQDGDGDGQNRFCGDAEVQHPLAAGLIETYGVTNDQLMAWFCEGHFGFGQIALALQTSQLTGDTPDALLSQRSEGRGWGQIWHDAGIINRSEDAGPPPWAGHGRPPWAGSKHEGGGKPCWAGPDPLPEGCVKPGGTDDEGDDSTP